MTNKKEDPIESLQRLFEERARVIFRDPSVLVEEVGEFQIRKRVNKNPFEADEEYNVSYSSRDNEPTPSSPGGKELSISFFYKPSSRKDPLIHIHWRTDARIETYLEAINSYFQTGEVVRVSPYLAYQSEPRLLSMPITAEAVEPELHLSQEMGEGIKVSSSLGDFGIHRIGADTDISRVITLEQLRNENMQQALGVFYETTTSCAMPRSVFDRMISHVLSDSLLKNN